MEPTLVELIEKRIYERPSFDEFCFGLVASAKTMSDDPNTQVGAVITLESNILSVTWNTFCGPIHELAECVPEKFERPEKYHWFEHAERNGIFQAARLGISLKGAKIHQNGLPCTDCARAIGLSGIGEVVVNKDILDAKDWKSPKYTPDIMERSLVILEQFKVKVRYWSKNG